MPIRKDREQGVEVGAKENMRAGLLGWLVNCSKAFALDFNWLHVISFYGTALVFGLLLCWMESVSFTQGVFMVTSAICVTGLSDVDFSQFSPPSMALLAVLMQAGGFGIVVFGLIAGSYIVTNLSKSAQIAGIMQQAFDVKNAKLARYMVFNVLLKYTLLIEGSGFFIMFVYLQWVNPHLLPAGQNRLNWALFHAISAFNNAGFAMEQDNLMKFRTDPVINAVIGGEIVLGGLGYTVLLWLHIQCSQLVMRTNKTASQALKQLVASPVQIMLALQGTALLLVVGTVVPMIIDFNNKVVADLGFAQKFMVFLFHSISTRTAGFNTIDLNELSSATKMLYEALMFIGANPGGTAGGVKITTMAVLIWYMRGWHRKPGQAVIVAHHKVNATTVKYAINLLLFSVAWCGFAVWTICAIESARMGNDLRISFESVQFEVISAFGTVGLSLGHPSGPYSLSGALTEPSQWILILTMLIGRIGPLVYLGLLPWPHNETPDGEVKDLGKNARHGTESLQVG